MKIINQLGKHKTQLSNIADGAIVEQHGNIYLVTDLWWDGCGKYSNTKSSIFKEKLLINLKDYTRQSFNPDSYFLVVEGTLTIS